MLLIDPSGRISQFGETSRCCVRSSAIHILEIRLFQRLHKVNEISSSVTPATLQLQRSQSVRLARRPFVISEIQQAPLASFDHRIPIAIELMASLPYIQPEFQGQVSLAVNVFELTLKSALPWASEESRYSLRSRLALESVP